MGIVVGDRVIIQSDIAKGFEGIVLRVYKSVQEQTMVSVWVSGMDWQADLPEQSLIKKGEIIVGD